MMDNIERNKAEIERICEFAHTMIAVTSKEQYMLSRILELEILSYGLNNSLANTQAVLEEATEHCEELQERLDKNY